jgi:Flp pilus assembly protein TadD
MLPGRIGGGRGSGTWMRRVYFRVGEISTEGAPTFAETEAARRAEEALRASPDSRDRHRAAVRALSRAGNLERALEVAEAWFGRDRLDPEALAARADLTARLGREGEALRLLSGTVDLRPDDATLQERLATAYERAGETERACAHRIALAEIDASAARVGAAMRCERAAGHTSYADALLASVSDERVRRNAETASREPAPELRTRGDLTVDATWSGGDDVSVSIITPDGTRLSWMGGRTTVVGRDATAAGHELVGVSRATVGNYVIEVVRTDASTIDRAISGDLRIRALDDNQTVHFTLGAGETRRAVGRVAVRRESRLEAVSGGGW